MAFAHEEAVLRLAAAESTPCPLRSRNTLSEQMSVSVAHEKQPLLRFSLAYIDFFGRRDAVSVYVPLLDRWVRFPFGQQSTI